MARKKGVCQSCGLAGETELYATGGAVDVVEEIGLKEIGFVIVPVQELCPICATLEGVAEPEVARRVAEYTDLMKISVSEENAQIGYIGPSSHPTPPTKLDEILFSLEEELKRLADERVQNPEESARISEWRLSPSPSLEEEEPSEVETKEVPEEIEETGRERLKDLKKVVEELLRKRRVV